MVFSVSLIVSSETPMRSDCSRALQRYSAKSNTVKGRRSVNVMGSTYISTGDRQSLFYPFFGVPIFYKGFSLKFPQKRNFTLPNISKKAAYPI